MEKRNGLQLFILLYVQYTCLCGEPIQKLVVAEGSTVTLTCPIQSAVVNLTWTKMKLIRNNSTPYTDGDRINPNLSHANRLRVVVNHNGNYDLQIMNISSFDEGVYKCSYIQNVMLQSRNVGLHLEKLPKNLRFIPHASGTDIFATEEHEQKLACVVQSGFPRETLTIVKNGNVVKSGGHGNLNYSFMAQRSDHMSMVECTVDSPLLKKTLSTRVRILVKYIPRVTIKEGSTLNVTEGRELRLTCRAECYPGIRNIFWSLVTNKGKFNLHESNSSLLVKKLNRDKAGEYVCNVENEVGTGKDKISVKVQYPPEVNIKPLQRKRFDCLPNGVPTSYTFLPWEHQSLFGEHIRFLDGYDNGTLLLDTLNTSESYQDNGVYVCTVTNGVANLNGTRNQIGKTTLHQQGRPVFVTDNTKEQFGTKGYTTILTFYIYSIPNVTSMSLHGGTRSKTYKNSQIGMQKKKVLRHIFHNKRIRVKGYTVKVGTFKLTAADFRNFTITAYNSVGKDDFHFELRAAAIPEMPVSIQVRPAVNAVTVSWLKGFNGGYQQHFYVEIKKETDQIWNTYGPFNVTENTYQTCELTGLESGTVYILHMFSNNTIGNSNRTDDIRTITTEHVSYSVYFGVATLVAIIVIGTIIIGTGIYQNYKKRREKELRDVINANAENAGVDPVENALYQSQNLHNSHTMSSATYSTIEGRGKPPGGHSIVSYSTADSDSDADICPGNHSKGKPVYNDDSNQRSDTSKENQLNYSEIIFRPSSGSKFVIRGLENKTTYSEVDFSKRASPLSSEDETESDSDDEDDFVNIAGIKQYVKRDTSCG